MADNMKLELVLLGKDFLGKILAKDIGLLKQFSQAGNNSANAANKLDAARRRSADAGAAAANATKKEAGETKKLGNEAEKAAKAEEKLNNARRGKATDGKTKQEAADKTKLAGATERAAAAEEKLNRARGRRGADGRLRDERGKFLPGGGVSGGRRGGNQSGFENDLAQGGTGAGTLWAAKKGMAAAMTQQEALSDVYNSFYRSSLSAGEMNGQMEKAEEISIRLGNKLKGNTSQFASMLSVMKQSGMEATTILDGAGEAAAYLAVANREDYSEVGKNYAQFGQLFGVKGREDNLKIADLMSRAKGKGISSDDLITASKYFGGRTAKTMGLTGAKGGEEVLRFMAFIKQNTALDASSVGTGSSAFFRAFTKDELKKNPIIPELEKKTGVKLDLFDEKGQFKGLENAVAKFAQLKGKLSDKESLQFGQELAGDEGAAVLGAMIEAGSTYQKANQDLNQMASMMTKAAKESDNLSNKVESLTGSLENLGAESFKPMLTPLGKLTDKTNEWIGSLTEAAKAKPMFAATTAAVTTLGGAYLALKGGSGVLSNVLNLAGQVGDSAATATGKVGGLRKSLGGLKGIGKIGLSVVVAEGTALAIAGVAQMIDEAVERPREMKIKVKAVEQDYDSLMGSGILYNAPGDYGKNDQNKVAMDAYAKKLFEAMNNKNDLVNALHPERTSMWEWLTNPNPYGIAPGQKDGGATLDPKVAAQRWNGVNMQDPNALARLLLFMKQGAGEANLNGNDFSMILPAIEQRTGKEKMQVALALMEKELSGGKQSAATPAKSFSELFNPLQSKFAPTPPSQFAKPLPAFSNGQFQMSNQKTDAVKLGSDSLIKGFGNLSEKTLPLGQSFSDLSGQTTPLKDSFEGLNTNSASASGSIKAMGESAAGFTNRVNGLEIKAPSFSGIQLPTTGQPSTPPARGFFNKKAGEFSLGGGRARGGSVKPGTIYPVGEIGEEWFTPETSGSIVSNDVVRGRNNIATTAPNSIVSNRKAGSPAPDIKIEIPVSVVINGGGENVDLKQLEAMLRREMRMIVKDELQPDKIAARVGYAVGRRSELS